MNPDDYNYGDDTTMPTDTGSTDTTSTENPYSSTVTLPAFNVTETKLPDTSSSSTGDDFYSNAQGPDGSDLGNTLSDFFSGIFTEAKKAAQNVAKQAISTAQQKATSSMNQSKTTTTTTSTTTNKTTILGLTPTQALLAVAGVAVLVYFASRGRGTATA